MTEFTSGAYNALKGIVGHSSAVLAVIYTVGHIVIAMTCNYIITGANLELAVIDALVEPIINGFWFYALHKFYNATKN